MQPNFAFYVHHHGSGHLMRALAIAAHLPKGSVSFLGSNLRSYNDLIPPDIARFHLPMDTAKPEDLFAKNQHIGFLHYSPLNIRGLAERSSMLINVLRAISPVLLVVDVSVEITLLATLAGFPTVVIRQNGNRNDQAHLHAYECAQLLIAPSPESLMNKSKEDWVEAKTFYSGGFSRYSHQKSESGIPIPNRIGILIGSGGTSLNYETVRQIALQCPDCRFEVMGLTQPAASDVSLPENVMLHRLISDPFQILTACELIIGNAGHNTVMEMADLNKKFICITEPRPFDEQVCKGDLLTRNAMCIVVSHLELANCKWDVLIERARALPQDRWAHVMNPGALIQIAEQLSAAWLQNFTIA